MAEMEGALLLSQLRKVPFQNERRKKNAFALFDSLKGLPGVEPCVQNPEADHHVFYLVILRYDSTQWDNLPREKLLAALHSEGIPCLGGYSFPLYENPLFRSIDFNDASSPYRTGRAHRIDFSEYRGSCPVAEKACHEEAIWLTHNLFLGTKDDALDIARALEKVYENREELRKAA
jgi:dTDP-4-amino-4,6-dideoxygalactose transaminase